MSREGGFSLVEVLVALAIVGFALAAGATTIANGMTGHETARDAGTALALAEQKLAEAGVTAALREGRSDGNFADRFDWLVTVAPYDDPDQGSDPSRLAAAPAAKLRLFRVAVSVAWRDGHHQRQLALSTLRIGPAAP